MDRQYYKGYHDVYWRGQWYSSIDELRRRRGHEVGFQSHHLVRDGAGNAGSGRIRGGEKVP